MYCWHKILIFFGISLCRMEDLPEDIDMVGLQLEDEAQKMSHKQPKPCLMTSLT